jgi:hypothetical protein
MMRSALFVSIRMIDKLRRRVAATMLAVVSTKSAPRYEPA